MEVDFMGILDGSASSGGSVNSAQNASFSNGNGMSNSYSRTYGTEASIRSALEADRANAKQQDFFNQTMAYNAAEAQKQRDFNYLMGNSIYTRSVKNMIEAGINPILAANFGLSAASVNSGAQASVSSPSAFMGQTFADQVSASHSEWASHSESKGSSKGSSWNESESGLAQALENMGNFIGAGLNALSSAKLFDITIGDGTKGSSSQTASEVGSAIKKSLKNKIDKSINKATGNHGIQFSDSLPEVIGKYLTR